jgi:hypothetical protein
MIMRRFKPSVERIEDRIVMSSNLFYTITDAISAALGTNVGHHTTGSSTPTVPPPPTHNLYVTNTTGLTATFFTDYHSSTTHEWTRNVFNLNPGQTVKVGTADDRYTFYVGASAVYGTKPNEHFYTYGNTHVGYFSNAWTDPAVEALNVPSNAQNYTANAMPNYKYTDG